METIEIVLYSTLSFSPENTSKKKWKIPIPESSLYIKYTVFCPWKVNLNEMALCLILYVG